MFREMRRKSQQITPEEFRRILTEEKRAVLSVLGDDGYPYGVPINFIYIPEDNSIYFHCAKEGHKLDSMRRCDKVCLTVHDSGYRKDDWSYYVNSVIVFGRASIIEDLNLKREKARAFGAKYIPTKEELEDGIDDGLSRIHMIRISIEHMTGKLVHEK